MSNTIQIKRSPLSAAPGTLNPGELAFVDHPASANAGGVEGVLYIGDADTGAVRTIGGSAGSAYVLDLLNDTVFTGNSDFTGAVATAVTQAPSDASSKIATTQYVNDRIGMSGGAFSTLTDTDFGVGTDANSQALANANIAIYDLAAGKWENKAVSGGNVVLDQEGGMTVTAVQADAINLETDSQQNYLAAVSGTTNEIQIVQSTGGGAGTRGVTSQIGLTTNVTIAGDLTVSGTTTQVNSTTVSVSDPVFVLGESVVPDAFDRGVEFNYNDGAVKAGFFGHDATANAFTYVPDGIAGNVAAGAVGNAIFADITGANITGTLVTANQPNVTTMGALVEVGTITTGAWNSTTQITTEFGGTGIKTVAAEGILVGAGGTADMTVLGIGSVGQKLSVSAGGSPEWSDIMDGGTF
tara:strand:- start:30 stop:1262 length:1233 start_codon:yes stop_codon:yes gene_type:complete